MSKLQQTAGNWVEQRCERVSYVYDELGGANTLRLTSTSWIWTVNAQSQLIPCSGGGFTE